MTSVGASAGGIGPNLGDYAEPDRGSGQRSVAEPSWRARLPAPPANVLVRSRSFRAADRCGYAIAAGSGSLPVVLEIVAPGAQDPGDRTDWTGLVGPTRHFVIHAPGPLVPSEGPAPWAIVRATEPDHPLTSLPEFMTSPESAGRLFGNYLPTGRPLSILIAHGAPAAHYFPDEPTSTARLLQLQKRHGYLTVFTSDPTPRRDYLAFDFAFDAQDGESASSPDRLRVARAPPEHLLRAGDDLRIPSPFPASSDRPQSTGATDLPPTAPN